MQEADDDAYMARHGSVIERMLSDALSACIAAKPADPAEWMMARVNQAAPGVGLGGVRAMRA